MYRHNALAALVLTVATGCGVHIGNGQLTSETRTVAPFDGIDISDAIDATLRLDPTLSGDLDVEVQAEANLMDRIGTHVATGTLYVGIADLHGVHTHRQIEVWATAARVSQITARDASSLVVDDIDEPTLDVTAHGASHIELSGVADELQVEAWGASNIDAGALTAESAVVDLDAASSVEICVTGAVRGTVDDASRLVVRCGGNTDGVSVRNAGSVNR